MHPYDLKSLNTDSMLKFQVSVTKVHIPAQVLNWTYTARTHLLLTCIPQTLNTIKLSYFFVINNVVVHLRTDTKDSTLTHLLNQLVNIFVGVERGTVNIVLTPLCSITGGHQLCRGKAIYQVFRCWGTEPYWRMSVFAKVFQSGQDLIIPPPLLCFLIHKLLK